jgi:hypothetical protein
MMRLDSEITRDISAEEELAFIARVKDFIIEVKPQVIFLRIIIKEFLLNLLLRRSFSFAGNMAY